jgi:hypothetical protein
MVCDTCEMKFPARRKQGINSTTTGNGIRENRELIRTEQGINKWLEVEPLATRKRLFRVA